ncbi:MAG: hypothetical protein JW947_04745 [Sedimentisphaerales bacterium]|nr:hypothetical protein [Sedimentisphaerales bacterium]
MRKSFVLIMVLALAASAHAALSLSLSSTQVAVDNIVTLSIYSDSSDWWQGCLVLSEDTYNWTDPVAARYGNIIVYPPPPGYVYPDPPSGPALDITSGGTASIQFAVEVISVQPGTIYLSLQDPSTYQEISSNGPLTLVVTPEPMTITLLALGGLLLRQRRKI